MNERYIKILCAIAKIIRNYRFFENEINFRKNIEKSNENCNIGKELYNYFLDSVLTEQEKLRLKSLKIYSQFKSSNKSKKNKTNIVNNIITLNSANDINNILNNEINQSNYDFINKNTIYYTGDNNENYLKLKENIKNIEDEELVFKTGSPKSSKIFNLGELSEHDEKNNLSNSPCPTISTSPSTSMIGTNKNCILSFNNKDLKLQEELYSCHEINLNYISK